MSDAPIMTMVETLQSLNSVPVSILPDEELKLREERAVMEKEDQYEQAWLLKMSGVSILGISKHLKISVRTVNRYIKEAKRLHLETIESDTAAQNLAGQIKTFEDYERLCLHEASLLHEEKKVDKATGRMIPTKEGQAALANKQRFLKLAMDARRSIVALYLDTGVLPKEAQRMYHTMEDEGKVKDKTIDVITKPKDRKEVISDLLEALETTVRV